MTLDMVMTFFRYNTKTQSKKEIMENLEFIKIKNFCCTNILSRKNKQTNKQKKQKKSHRLGENICKNTSDKGLLSKYTRIFKLNSKKAHYPTEKWAKDLHGTVIKEDIQMTHKKMKSCSISYTIKLKQ